MNYAKVNGVWHVAYNSTMDHAHNKMLAKTICGEMIAFDTLARGEDEKSDHVCADCEMLLRSGDQMLRDIFPNK